ncbi:glucosylceramide transporter ABCA12 [Bombina bombina]|uniref:glucosylceramide transporter ABCA12 n=1 Tax=Bombina bombina TaxID=8345 RepID=UPI00235AB12D|nr:glucosylceramide transporter ABCA12 [Bombina bombina]
MASFFHQLRVLLWKNWLSVKRQPVWTLVLILWPVVIFLIMAVVRTKFLPTQRSNCYLAPRNLQSTGFFPFLQNYLCDTDTKCINQSYVTLIEANRIQKRSVDDGGGGGSTTKQTTYINKALNSSTNTSAAISETSIFQEINYSLNLTKTVPEDLNSGDVKGALCGIITPFISTEQETQTLQHLANNSLTYCRSNQTFSQFVVTTLLSQMQIFSWTDISATVINVSNIIQEVQDNTGLWEMLLKLPRWIHDVKSFISEWETILNITTRWPVISELQSCIKYILVVKRQVEIQNISFSNNESDLMGTLEDPSLISKKNACVALYQRLPCAVGTGQCWAGEKFATDILLWLVTSLSDGTANNKCIFSGTSLICNTSVSWEYLVQSIFRIQKEATSDPTAPLRMLHRVWVSFKQSTLDELVLKSFQQEIISQFTEDPQLQSVLTKLVFQILNTTDFLVTESLMSPQSLNVSTLLEILQTLLGQLDSYVSVELQMIDLTNTTTVVNTFLQTLIHNAEQWNSFGSFLSSNNLSSEALKELQSLTNHWLNMNSEVGTINDTATIIKLLAALNQAEYIHLKQAFQNILSLHPSTLTASNFVFDAFNVFNQIYISNTSDSFLLFEAYLKQISNFLNSDTSMQSVLLLLNNNFNISNQLSFLQSDVLINVLSLFTQSSLQNVSSLVSNTDFFKMFTNFIPVQEQDTFNKVANITLTLVQSVIKCQNEVPNCMDNIIHFQQTFFGLMQNLSYVNNSLFQLPGIQSSLLSAIPTNAEISVISNMILAFFCSQPSSTNLCHTPLDVYHEILGVLSVIGNITLKNELLQNTTLLEELNLQSNSILQVLGSKDATKLLLELQNIRGNECYYHIGAPSLQCTLELSINFINLIQKLPLAQSVNNSLFAASSILTSWLENNNGTTNLQQELMYLYNITTLMLQNGSTIQDIQATLINIVQTLEEIRLKTNASQETEILIGNIIDLLQSTKRNDTIPIISLSEMNQQLDSIKSQLDIIQWYVIFVKNKTESFQKTLEIQPLATMTELILKNILFSFKDNLFFINETENIFNMLDKSNMIPVLQSILNVALQSGVQNIEQFINHTVYAAQIIIKELVNETLWNSPFNGIVQNDIDFVLQLLQEFDKGTLSNLKSVLNSMEKMVPVLQNIRNETWQLLANDNISHVIYNMFKEVIGIIVNSKQTGNINSDGLYNIYKLWVQGMNEISLESFPSVEEKLMNLLYFSVMPPLENDASSATNQNITALNILNIINVIFNDSYCQSSLAISSGNNDEVWNSILESALNSTMKGNFTSCITGSPIVKEVLGCLMESLEIFIQFVDKANYIFNLDIHWIQQLNETITLTSHKLSEYNATCMAMDRHIVEIMHQVFDNQLSSLQKLLFLTVNQTVSQGPYSMTHFDYWIQALETVKLYIISHEQNVSNDLVVNTMNNIISALVDASPNGTSNDAWFTISALWKVVDSLSTKLGTSNLDFLYTIENLNSLLNLTRDEQVLEMMLSNQFSRNIYVESLNLIKLWIPELNLSSAESCKNSLKSYYSPYQMMFSETNLMLLIRVDELLSNVSAWACNLIYGNDSTISWMEEMKIVTALIQNVQSAEQLNFSNYSEVTLQILSSFKDIIDLPTIESFIKYLSESFKEQNTMSSSIIYQALHDLLNSLKNLVSEALSTGIDNPFSIEKITSEAVQAADDFLRSLNVTGYEDVFSSASEVLQLFYNSRNASLPVNNFIQKMLHRVWVSFKQSTLDELVLKSFQQEIISQFTEDPQLQSVLTKLVFQILNTTDFLVTESLMNPQSLNVSTLLEILQTLLGQLDSYVSVELQMIDLTNTTTVVNTFLQTLIHNAEQWNSFGSFLSSNNLSSEALKELQSLTNHWLNMNSEVGTINDTATIIKLLAALNQAEYIHLKQAFQNILSLHPSTLTASNFVFDAFNVFNQIYISNTSDSFLLFEAYLKQISNFLNSDTSMQSVLLLLNNNFNISNQLSFLQSDVLINVLSLFTQSSLQNVSSLVSNTDFFKMFTNFIPVQEQDTFNKVANITLTLVQSVIKCQNEVPNCMDNIIHFQQTFFGLMQNLSYVNNSLFQLPGIQSSLLSAIPTNAEISVISNMILAFFCSQPSSTNLCHTPLDVYHEILVVLSVIGNITLKNELLQNTTLLEELNLQSNSILQVLGSKDATKLLLELQNIRGNECYYHIGAPSLQCTLELSINFINLIQKLPLAQSVNDSLFAASSILTSWLENNNGTTDLQQELMYLYNITTLMLQNVLTIQDMHSTLINIVQILEEIRSKINATQETENLIGNIIDLLQSTKRNDTIPIISLSEMNQQLDSIKSQLDIIQWYVIFVKNKTESVQTTMEIQPLLTMTELILKNILFSFKDNLFLINETEKIFNMIDKSNMIPVLQSILNVTLQSGVQNIDQFINHTVYAAQIIFKELINENHWNSPLNGIVQIDIDFVLQLLQEFDKGTLSNLNSALIFMETMVPVLQNIRNETWQLVANDNISHIIYNMFKEVIGIIVNSKQTGNINSDGLYNIYKLWVQGMNEISLQSFPSVEEKLMNLLYFSVMPPLENDASSATNQNITALNILNIIDVIFNDSYCQSSLAISSGNNDEVWNSILESALNSTMKGNFTSCITGSPIVKEVLGCLMESLEIFIQFVDKANNIFNLDIHLIQQLNETITLTSHKLSEYNVTCMAIDRHIVEIMHQVFDNQLTSLKKLLFLTVNQTVSQGPYSMKHFDYWIQALETVKLYIISHEQNVSNDLVVNTMNDIISALVDASQNGTSNDAWFAISALWKVVDSLSTKLGTSNLDFLYTIENLNSLLNITRDEQVLEMMLSNQFSRNIYVESLNLIKLWIPELNLSSAESCKSSLKSYYSPYQMMFSETHLMLLIRVDELLSNVSAWACNLIYGNDSTISWMEEMKIVTALIQNVQSAEQLNFSNYSEGPLQILSSFKDIIDLPTIESFIKYLSESFKEQNTMSSSIIYQSLHDLLNSLKNLVSEALSTGIDNPFSIEKITSDAVQAADYFLRSLNVTGYEDVFSSASEVLQLYYNSRNASLPVNNFIQKLLSQIKALSPTELQILQSHISGQNISTQDKLRVLEEVLNIFFIVMNESALEMILPPPYNNNSSLILNTINNILGHLKETIIQEYKNGKRNITEFIANQLDSALHNAHLWKNISLNWSFLHNDDSKTSPDFEYLIDKWISISNKEYFLDFSSELINTFYLFWVSGNKTQTMQSIQYILNSNNNIINASFLVDSLEIFYELSNLTSTSNVDGLTELYVKQLLSYILSDSQLQKLLMEVNIFFNTSQNIQFLQSTTLKDTALQMLDFFHPLNIYNTNMGGSNLTLFLLEGLSQYMPAQDQEYFKNIAKAVVSVLQILQNSNNHSETSATAVSGFQQLFLDVLQTLNSMENNSLEMPFSSSSLLQCEMLEKSQISLINNIYMVKWYTQGNSNNFSDSFKEVYKEVVSVGKLIVNITEACLNSTIPQPTLAQIMLANLSLQIFNDFNVTELYQQLQSLLRVSSCLNQTSDEALLCTFNSIPHLLGLLQTLHMPDPLAERINILSSITNYWMREISTTANISQQITHLYELTEAALLKEVTVHTTLTVLRDIVQNLQDIGVQNGNSSDLQQSILLLTELLQPNNIFNPTNMTSFTAQLEYLEVQLQIVQWYVQYINNNTNENDISSSIYPMYRLTQIILSNGILSMQDWVTLFNHSNNILGTYLSAEEVDTLFQLFIHLFTSNQTYSWNQSEFWLQISDIIQKLNLQQNFIMSMSSKIMGLSQMIDKLFAGNLSIELVEELEKIVQIILTERNITIGLDIKQLFDSLISIVNQTYSIGQMDFTGFSNLNSFSVMDCQYVFSMINSIYNGIQKDINPQYLSPYDALFSDISTEICYILTNQNNWTNLFETVNRLVNLTLPLIPDNMKIYFIIAQNIVSVALEMVSEPSSVYNTLWTVLEFVPTLTQLFDKGTNTTDWLDIAMVQNLFSLLVDMFSSHVLPKETILFKTENIILETMQVVQKVLDSNNEFRYTPVLSFSSDLVKVFFREFQNTSDKDSFATLFLKQVWYSFTQNNSKINQLIVELYPANPNYTNQWKTILQLVSNITDILISEISPSTSYSYISSKTIIQVLQMVFGNLKDTFLPETNDVTQILEEFIHSIMNVTEMFMTTSGNTTINQLQMLISSLTSNNLGTSFPNDTAKLAIKLLAIINQTSLNTETSHILLYGNLIINSLDIFNELIRLDINSTIQDFFAILTKHLPNVSNLLDLGNQTQSYLDTIKNVWLYLTSLEEQQSIEMNKMSVQVLTLFLSPELQTVSTDIHKQTSAFFSFISGYIPAGELEGFHRIANASLNIIQSMQTCSVQPANCSQFIEGFQSFVLYFSQFQAMIQNKSLEEQSIDRLILQLQSLDYSQKTLINDIFVIIWYAQGHQYNASEKLIEVYDEVISMISLIWNSTEKDNVTPTKVIEVLTSANITEFLLKVQNILLTSTCANQTGKDPSLCSLNLVLQLTDLLKVLPLDQSFHDRLSAISTTAEKWLSKLNIKIPIYQQLTDLYNITPLAGQYEPILQAINNSVADIIQLLNETGLAFNFTLNGQDELINFLSEILHVSSLNTSIISDLSMLLQYNMSDYLENIKIQLGVVNWLMLQMKHLKGALDTFPSTHTMQGVAQWMLDSNPYIDAVIRETELMMNLFIQPFNLTNLLQIFNMLLQNEQLRLILNPLQVQLQTLSNISFFENLISNEYFQKDAEIALYLLNNVENISVALTSINKALLILQEINSLGFDFPNIFDKLNSIKAGNIFAIIKEAMKILYNIKENGAISKDMIFRIYNFTYLLVQDELDWVPFQNQSAMEAEFLDVWYLAMHPFLGGNKSQEYTENCTAEDVLHILIQTVLQNTTGNETTVETNCQWHFGLNNSDNSIINSLPLQDIIYAQLQSSSMFHDLCSDENLNPLAEEMACIMHLLELSSRVLAQVNNLSGLHIPWIQTMHDSLSIVCDDDNSTFEYQTHLVDFLDYILVNQSSQIQYLIYLLQNFNDSSIQVLDLLHRWPEIAEGIMTLISSQVQYNNNTYEIVKLTLNVTTDPQWFESLEFVQSIFSTNWTAVEFDGAVSVLESLRRALILIDGGLNKEEIQIYQAIVTLVQNPNMRYLYDLATSSLMNQTECTGAFSALTIFSSSVWVAVNPAYEPLEEEFLYNLSALTCNLLQLQPVYYNWTTGMNMFKNILSFMAKFIPNSLSNYLMAAEKVISFLSNMDTSPEKILDGVIELLVQETEIFINSNNTVLLQESYFLHGISSLVKTLMNNSFSSGGTSEQIYFPEEALNLFVGALNATSFAPAISSLSDLIIYTLNNTNNSAALSSITLRLLQLQDNIIKNVQTMSLVDPYNSALSCLKNRTEALSNHSLGQLDEAIRLIQALFIQSNVSVNASLMSDLYWQKVSQLQNLTTLLCGDGDSNLTQSSCYFSCQFQTILQDVAGYVAAEISQTSTVATFSLFNNILLFSDSTWQSLENDLLKEIHTLFNNTDIQKVTETVKEMVGMTEFNFKANVESLFRNSSQVKAQLNQVVEISNTSIEALMQLPIPENFRKIFDWFDQFYACSTNNNLQAFCSLSPEKSYQMTIIFVQNVDIFKLFYSFFVPLSLQEEISSLQTMFDMLIKKLADIPVPADENINKMIDVMQYFEISKNANPQSRSTTTTSASFMDISKYICNKNYIQLTNVLSSYSSNVQRDSSTHSSQRNQNLQELYGIPNDNPFCAYLFLNLVNTTKGSVYWLLLKPLIYGKILYTPDTPETKLIMEKANETLETLLDFKTTISQSLPYLEVLINNWNIIEKLPQLIDPMKNLVLNPFMSGFLQLFMKLDTMELVDLLDKAANMTQLGVKDINSIASFQSVAEVLANLTSCVVYNRMQGVESVEEMNKQAEELLKTNELMAAITFNLTSDTNRQKRAVPEELSLPKLIKYTIRMRAQLSVDTDNLRDTYWIPGPHSTMNPYSRGFVYLQDSIERAIIKLQTNKSLDTFAAQFQPMPFPCYKKDDYLVSMSFSLPIAMMITWVLFVAAFVKKLVHEKDLRLHEYMKMMGVNSCSHFFAWFIESFSMLLITISILVMILKFGYILPYSNGFILFVFFLDYSLTVIALSYLISVFFHNTNVAALSGSLIYIILFFPFLVMQSKEQSLSFSAKSLLSLFSPTALSYGMQYIIRYESQEIGMQWDNMYTSPVLNDTFTFGWICWLMLIDSLLYFTVACYIRIVFPGKYGIGAPWYFLFQPSFWLECCGFAALRPRKPSGLMFSNIMSHGTSQKKGADSNFEQYNEQEPSELPIGVSLHGLTKTYKSKAAVKNLNLNFYEGHITSLLGHNGAGKTTTLSMLTGLFRPSSGTIYVYGEDVSISLNQIRKSMGVCMQYDVLFDHLTTKEHLLLYGMIKAPQWTRGHLHEEVKRTLKDTGLYNHRHKPVKALSGGMRRKLSICIAMIGGSRVIILDEPTTGVDPCSRRSIWEVISKNKKDKTIILSTHHLDEAEILSDRIAFLEYGGLKCCGTPMYLKEKFGTGYHLTLTKKFPNREDNEHCSSEMVTDLIHSHIPEACLKEDVGGELIYNLPPFSADLSSAYLALLRDLDSKMDELHIGCYGISDTTIEEVFLKLTDGLDEDDDDQTLSRTQRTIPVTETDNEMVNDETSSSSYSFTERDDQALTGTEKVTGVQLMFKKIGAMFIKRFHNSRRNWKGLVSQIVLPVLFVIAAMGLGRLSIGTVEYPEILLSPNLYGTSSQPVVFENLNAKTVDLMSAMDSFPGIDNSCLNQNSQCFHQDTLGLWNSTGSQNLLYGSCNCNTGTTVCTATNATPPHRRTYSGQMLYNLTKSNMEQYLLSTALETKQQRYGGWSFGIAKPSDLTQNVVPETLSKIWYNPEGPHSLPAFLNSFNNFLLRSNVPSSEKEQYGISVSTQPYSGTLSSTSSMSSSLVNTLVALCILVGYSITTASFGTYVVKESHTGAKRLQHISGIGEICYWCTNFLYDMTMYLIPVALSIAMIAVFKLPAFYNYPNLGAVSLFLILFGYATFPWMYLLAGTFKNHGMAFIIFVSINLFLGINTIISSSVVYTLKIQTDTSNKDYQVVSDTYDILTGIFKIFPQFCFGYGLTKLSQQQALVEQYSLFGKEEKTDIFSMDILGWMYVALAIQGTVCFILRLLINDGIIYSVKCFFKRTCLKDSQGMPRNPEEDEDVQAERERVESGKAESDLLKLQNLTKVFHQVNKNMTAVNNMSLGIPAGECFGLLGVNGAGKTTTFKMLTGDISPSKGQIQVRNPTGQLVNMLGFNTDWSTFGYCPQEDALDELLTGEEHLYFYARIRGIPEKVIKTVSFNLLSKLQLLKYKDRITSNYSCGTRRKLSTALALVGRPSILLLDEPSSGMDPKTKRHLWKIISDEVRDKCAVVLTSHSMEECEALCTRLAIMVKGKFQCIGPLQHIKSRFGSGFTVKIYLKDTSVSVDRLTDFMDFHFPNTNLKDQHLSMVEYHVPVTAGGVANIFDLLETNKTILNIINFSVSQTTLDEVFINFAQPQASLDNSTANSQEFDQVVVT